MRAVFACLVLAAPSTAQVPIAYVQTLIAQNSASFGYQGRSFAVDGRCQIIGNWGDGTFGQNSGAARIYERGATGWIETTTLTASDAATQSYFGLTVAMRGDTAAVGAYQDLGNGTGCGAAYVFRRVNGQWLELAKLVPSDGAVRDQFSFSLAVLDGVVIATAPYADASGEDSGAAYVFTEQPGGAWVETQKIVPTGCRPADRFGFEVAADGNTALIGAHWFDIGSAENAGAIFAYESNAAGQWVEVARLQSAQPRAGDWFGISVDIEADTAVIGARFDSELATHAGSAYVFERAGGQWQQRQKLFASDFDEIDFFGWSVDISGSSILVGAPLDDDQGFWSGSAYLFERNGQQWLETAKFIPPDGGQLDYFGVDVAIAGCELIVSAPEYDLPPFSDTGAVYVFNRCPQVLAPERR